MIMKRLKNSAVFFVIGGVGYAAIELLWRGRTHWSMVLAGGICFVVFSKIAKRFKGRSLIFKALLCALCITVVELVFGVVFNILLGMQVWDYSGMRYNLWGQICPIFSLAWTGLALIFIPIADLLNGALQSKGTD